MISAFKRLIHRQAVKSVKQYLSTDKDAIIHLFRDEIRSIVVEALQVVPVEDKIELEKEINPEFGGFFTFITAMDSISGIRVNISGRSKFDTFETETHKFDTFEDFYAFIRDSHIAVLINDKVERFSSVSVNVDGILGVEKYSKRFDIVSFGKYSHATIATALTALASKSEEYVPEMIV